MIRSMKTTLLACALAEFLVLGFAIVPAHAAGSEANVFRFSQSQTLSAAQRYLTEERYARAEKMAKAALRERPTDGEKIIAYSYLCAAQLMRGAPDQAIASCNAALALDPSHWQSRLNRGNALLANQQAGAAIADFEAALTARPNAAAIQAQLDRAKRAAARKVAAN